jgi:hypothetical protein
MTERPSSSRGDDFQHLDGSEARFRDDTPRLRDEDRPLRDEDEESDLHPLSSIPEYCRPDPRMEMLEVLAYVWAPIEDVNRSF